MTTYPADQVASVAVGEARTILTDFGLPDGRPAPFHPAHTLHQLDSDPRYLVIGAWGREGVLIALDIEDGRVVGYTPWANEIYQVNTSLHRFVDCINAIKAAAPLSPDNPRYNSYDAAGDHVLAALAAIDPDELSDSDSFWLDIADDIKVGDYDTE
ncbi:SUKH-4 family immunity protein [Micromonospora inaquosa]|uniref:SUKH-4 immunity protein n=1 Tax=Micromonospora inaquosa TaxID=2203716 RepID=A0A3N9WQ91_9ACTN|nr:SUKH-4 family immunity protein [Micromonospora inaquosa]RQX02996.1 hypothetical protein DLJ59_13615 [Micromonospora inaquosa]